MALPPSARVNQDMPPKGGYPSIKYLRRSPKRVPGAVIFGGIAAAMIYGYYQMHNTNMHQRELKQEERAVRLNLVPFLQAESDARYVRDRAMYAEWEANVMKDVPGWEVQKPVLHNTSVWLDNAPTVP